MRVLVPMHAGMHAVNCRHGHSLGLSMLRLIALCAVELENASCMQDLSETGHENLNDVISCDCHSDISEACPFFSSLSSSPHSLVYHPIHSSFDGTKMKKYSWYTNETEIPQ